MWLLATQIGLVGPAARPHAFTRLESVIWATGYKENADWIAIPEAKDGQGNLLHRRGVSPVPHLYLIGRSWQWTRGSALLTGVGGDAVMIKDHIVIDVGEREQPERVVQILQPERSQETKTTL